MGTRLHLAPGKHAVLVDGDLVVLDTGAGQYLFLPEVSDRIALDAGGALCVGDPAAARDLVAAGLAQTVARSPEAPLEPARRSLADPTAARPLTLAELARLGAALLDAMAHYRGRTLAHLLAYARGGGGRVPGGDDDRVVVLSAAFARLAPWLPIPGKCLLRSFVLLRFLQRSGCSARWVFAVRTAPFGAHCWLQVRDIVLDDEVERLAPFHRICVV